MSPRPVGPANIAKAMASYNQAVAEDYISLRNYQKARLSSDEINPEDEYQSKLASLIAIHTRSSGGHQGSPFASTSTSEYVGFSYGSDFSIVKKPTHPADFHGHGISIAALTPLYGTLQTFGQEETLNKPELPLLVKDSSFKFRFPHEAEVLIAGGIDPNSIESIKVFDNQVKESIFNYVPAIVASRKIVDTQLRITIKNYLESKSRTYAYNASTKGFEFIEESDFDMAEEGIIYKDGKLKYTSSQDTELIANPDDENEEEIFEPEIDDKEMVDHLVGGKASLMEVDQLIYNGLGQTVIEHIGKIDPDQHTHIAGQLILFNWGAEVASKLDRFKNIDYMKIAGQLIDLYQGADLMNHFEAFKGLDHNAIAQKLINNQQTSVLVVNLDKFTDLSASIAQQIIADGGAKQVKQYQDHFSSLDEPDLATLATVKTPEEEAAIAKAQDEIMSRIKEGTATLEEISTLIDQGNSWDVAKNIGYIADDLHPKIASRIVENGAGAAVVHYLHNFRHLNHKAIAQRLIDKDLGWIVAEKLDAFSDLDHTSVAQQLIDHGRISIVAMNLKNFTNLDQSIAEELISNVYAYRVKENLNHFSHLDESIMQQLAD